MSLLDALECPYCRTPLVKESYYLRCLSEHRYTFAVEPANGGWTSAGQAGEGDEQADGFPVGEVGGGMSRLDVEVGAGPPRTPTGRRLVFRVIGHPDRREIGVLHVFPIDAAGR